MTLREDERMQSYCQRAVSSPIFLRLVRKQANPQRVAHRVEDICSYHAYIIWRGVQGGSMVLWSAKGYEKQYPMNDLASES